MGTAQSDGPMEADELLDADTQILDVLRDGRSTKGMLVDETDFSRNTVYNRLEVLEASGHIQLVHDGTRLFELVDDPRGDTETQDAPQADASIEVYKQTIQEFKDERDEAVAKRAQAEETQEEYAQRVLDAEDIDRDALEDCVGYLETALDTIPEDTPGRLLVGDAYRTLTAVLNESENQ